MKELNNWNNLQESETTINTGLQPGIYALKIVNVEDVPDKEYLKVYVEITDGDNKGYFESAAKRVGKWLNQGIWYASYKETAGRMFKAFITAVQKSNTGYVWNWDEKSLVGKVCVGVFGEEEYLYNGEARTSVKMREIRSFSAWKNGDIKTPEIKKLKVQPQATAPVINDKSLPF